MKIAALVALVLAFAFPSVAEAGTRTVKVCGQTTVSLHNMPVKGRTSVSGTISGHHLTEIDVEGGLLLFGHNTVIFWHDSYTTTQTVSISRLAPGCARVTLRWHNE